MDSIAPQPGEVFLVLTGCEDFWDTSKPLVFLGEQTRRFSRRAVWGPLGGQVLGTPWATNESLAQASQYVRDLSEAWRPTIADNLNSIHGLQYSTRYWRILLAHWLFFFLGALYDRFARISEALRLYPAATTKALHPDSFATPVDLLDFSELLKGDLYNQQLYTEILHHFGRCHPSRRAKVSAKPFSPPKSRAGWRSIFPLIKHLSDQTLRCRPLSHTVITRSLLAPPVSQVALSLRTGARVWPSFAPVGKFTAWPLDQGLRSKLARSLVPQDDFQRLATELLGKHIPQTLMEGFRTLEKQSQDRYPVLPKTILSANAWYFDELFMHWAARSAENGTRLLGMQHGGNYGSVADHFAERHELAICDQYFTWGWTGESSRAKIIPTYSLKLMRSRPRGNPLGGSGVLFGTTCCPTYPVLLTPFDVRFSEYLDWQRRFNSALPAGFRKLIHVRFHHEDFGWDFAARWKEWNPDAIIEGWSLPFTERLRRSRLYVCDHLSTTFVEALAANHPTILFWNPDNTPLRDAAKPYYEALRAAGILFDTPESAAEMLTTAYGDVERWWHEPKRQAARVHFCERFAKTGSGALREWVSLLTE
jgi:putative transferase (TIGR04331 family)